VRDETVARNYAEALFELAIRHEGVEVYGEGIEAVARLLDEDGRFRLFLETPRIDADSKKDVLRKAFGEAFPRPLLNFLLITVDKRRQRLLRTIAREFHALVDEHENRVHVEVTVARALDQETLDRVRTRLTEVLGKTAIPHVRVKPEILGGVVFRTGDTIYDGSLRRRLDRMRRQLLAAELPSGRAAGGA
jgi:F-type H+-transporting ATPase subunit delta